MSRIRIKNFGPIKEGFKDADGNDWMDIKKITVFIGNQGSGKSTVAKLYSTFSWMEKALSRGDLTMNYLSSYNRFRKEYCGYQRLHNYFRSDGSTELHYIGRNYIFHYHQDRLVIERNVPDPDYLRPKIMYVPAERNFLSAIVEPEKVKGMPPTLKEFGLEVNNAYSLYGQGKSLPFKKINFRYDKQNKIPWIVGEGYELRLSEAASGYQSFIPLFLVSEFLIQELAKPASEVEGSLSAEEEKRLKKEVEAILNNDSLLPELRRAALQKLTSKYRNKSFLNIVEEPEQNLFPSSQRTILNELIKCTNQMIGNQLILTTHSPYILTSLNNLMYAYNVGKENYEKTDKIIPSKYWLNPNDVSIFKLIDGKSESIIDEELKQIKVEEIDEISEILSNQWHQMAEFNLVKD